MARPVSPEKIVSLKTKQIPDSVFQVFNQLIGKNFSNGSAVVTKDEAVQAILEQVPQLARETIFENGWLDVEDAYRSAGWKVEYVKMPYYDKTPSYFTFTKRRHDGSKSDPDETPTDKTEHDDPLCKPQACLQLVVRVSYSPNGTIVDDLRCLLYDAVQRMMGDGITGTTPAEVDEWSMDIAKL